MTALVPWWCLLVHVMGISHGHIYRHGKSWNGYDFHTYPHPATKPVIPRDIMVDVINDLGLKLLAIHNEYNENNIAISPYGALSVLVTLGEGVEGEGIYEIHQATHIPIDISVIRVGLRDIHRHLKSYFIPKEGFLAGLTLNHENVTLRPEYEEILKFYGYDTATFNNALYPLPQTTESPIVPFEETSTLEPQTTTEIGRTDMVDMSTTQSTTETTTLTDILTSEVMPTVEPKTLLETTTSVITISDTTSSLPQSTTTTSSLPESTTTILPPTMQEITTAQTSTTTELPPETTSTIATTESTTTEESVTIPSTGTSSLSTQETTLEITSSTTESPITTTIGTTESIIPSETPSSTNSYSTVEPLETGTTTEQSTILTTSLLSTLSTTEATSTSIPETTESGTILSSLLTTTQTSTLPTETTDSTTTLLVTSTTEPTTSNSEDVTLSTTVESGDAFLGDNGTLYTSNTDSTSTIPSSTETTTITSANDNDSEKDNKDNEVDSTDPSANTDGFGGISKRIIRSGVISSNQTNVIKLNNRDALFGTSNFGYRRNSRSVADYIIARYYDDQFNFHNNPDPYVPEEQPSFLVYGKYREYNINFIKYNTVLPFHYEPHLDAFALSFPLDSTKYYLLLLLPVDETGIDKLICDLRLNGSIKNIIANLQYRHVIATIPSFTLKGYVTLTPSLQKLGIRKVFEPRQADFSPMTNQKGIYVTNIEQAITVTIRNYVDPNTNHLHRNLHRYDPVHFKADHPFLYFVIDSDIHVTLMAGKIVNPLNSRIR